MCFIFPPLEDEENHIYLLHFWDVFFVLGCVFEMGKDCVYNIYIYYGYFFYKLSVYKRLDISQFWWNSRCPGRFGVLLH